MVSRRWLATLVLIELFSITQSTAGGLQGGPAPEALEAPGALGAGGAKQEVPVRRVPAPPDGESKPEVLVHKSHRRDTADNFQNHPAAPAPEPHAAAHDHSHSTKVHLPERVKTPPIPDPPAAPPPLAPPPPYVRPWMSLEEMLEQQANERGQIIITAATYQVGEEWWFLYNWVANLYQKTGLTNYIVLIADTKTYEHCSMLGLPCYMPKGVEELKFLWKRGRFKDASEESLALRIESSMKVQTMVEALLLNYTVLFSDTNTVFYEEPFKALEHKTDLGFFDRPVRSLCTHDGNAWFGLVYARPENAVIGLFKVLNAAQHDSGAPWDNSLFTSVVGSKSMWADSFACLHPEDSGFIDNCFYAKIKAGGKGAGAGAATFTALDKSVKRRAALYGNCLKQGQKRGWLKEVEGWMMPRCSTRPCLELEELSKGEAKALGVNNPLPQYKKKHWGREHEQACDRDIYTSIDRPECFRFGNCTCACDKVRCNEARMLEVDLLRDWLDAGTNHKREEAKAHKKAMVKHKEPLRPRVHPPSPPPMPLQKAVATTPVVMEAFYLFLLFVAAAAAYVLYLGYQVRDEIDAWARGHLARAGSACNDFGQAALTAAVAAAAGIVACWSWCWSWLVACTAMPILPGDRGAVPAEDVERGAGAGARKAVLVDDPVPAAPGHGSDDEGGAGGPPEGGEQGSRAAKHAAAAALLR